MNDFQVIAAVKQGDPIAPRALIRFEADVSPSYDLFFSTGESVGPFEVVVQSFSSGDSRTLFGTMQLQYQAGEWSASPVIENPLHHLGQPRDMFSSPTIVLGSEEQSALLASLAAVAERAAAVEDLRQRNRERLLALFESFGRRIPVNIRCQSTDRGATVRQSVSPLFSNVTQASASGLSGYADDKRNVGVGLVLLNGSVDSPRSMRFQFSQDYSNIMDGYIVTMDQNGAISARTSGELDFPDDGSAWNRPAECSVAIATGG